MTGQDYSASITANITAQGATERINRVADWWTANFTGASEKVGDVFTVRFGETFVDFAVVELVPARRIVWRVTDCNLHFIEDKKEWKDTRVVFDLSSDGAATTVTMTHAGLLPDVECYENCRKGWNFFIKESLQKLLSENQGIPDRAEAKPMAPSYRPSGFHTLTAHLTVSGAAQYIDFLQRAFDAVELSRSASPDGRLLNASVRVGDSVLMLNDVFPEFGGEAYRSGRALRLTLYLPDANAAWTKALGAGCRVASPIRQQFWGDRYGEVEDPFGFVWAIATHLEDLTPEEIEGRRKKMFDERRPPSEA